MHFSAWFALVNGEYMSWFLLLAAVLGVLAGIYYPVFLADLRTSAPKSRAGEKSE